MPYIDKKEQDPVDVSDGSAKLIILTGTKAFNATAGGNVSYTNVIPGDPIRATVKACQYKLQ